MRTSKTLAFFTIALASAACGDDGGLSGDDTPDPDGPTPDVGPGVIEILEGDIATDQTWTANNTYILKGYVFVTGGTLTITKNGKINAVGTAVAPIIFTSSQQGPPAPGDWGGIVLLGKATINVTGGINAIEGFASSFGDRVIYGAPTGTANDAHDCGKLKYARIQYAGFQLSAANELNGLTIGGCGSATEIDFVQSHLGQDDGIEVFGGTVNLKHLVISDSDDDGLDWDLGWVGKAQFVIVKQKDGRGDKGFEADNHPNAFDNLPRSAPEIWNATLVGGNGLLASKKQGGMHLRRGTAGKISNVIVLGFNQFAIDIDGANSVTQLNTGVDGTVATPDDALFVNHSYFQAAAAQPLYSAGFDAPNGTSNDANGVDEEVLFGAVARNGHVQNPMLTDPTNVTLPNFKPLAGSPVLTGCGTPSAGLDTTATYCGAIGADDWTAGWTAYPL